MVTWNNDKCQVILVKELIFHSFHSEMHGNGIGFRVIFQRNSPISQYWFAILCTTTRTAEML